LFKQFGFEVTQAELKVTRNGTEKSVSIKHLEMAVNEFARCPRRKTKEDQKHEDKEIFATEPLSVGGNR
jgi:hypothetical protein